MYWYPFREIGGVKKANLDAAVNLDVKDGKAAVGFYTTAAHPAAKVSLKAGQPRAVGGNRRHRSGQAVPEAGRRAGRHRRARSGGLDFAPTGRELVSYVAIRLKQKPMPTAVTPPPPPKDIQDRPKNCTSTGLRIEQFHDPGITRGLLARRRSRRDPGDIAREHGAGDRLPARRPATPRPRNTCARPLERLTDKLHDAPRTASRFITLALRSRPQGKNDEASATLLQGHLEHGMAVGRLLGACRDRRRARRHAGGSPTSPSSRSRPTR